MATARTVIGSASGLHARPASLFVTAVAKSGAAVTIAKGEGAPANAASLLSVLTLGARHGDEVELSVTGELSDEVLAELVLLLESDLDKG